MHFFKYQYSVASQSVPLSTFIDSKVSPSLRVFVRERERERERERRSKQAGGKGRYMDCVVGTIMPSF